MLPHALIKAAAQAATKIRCPNCGHMNEPGAEKCSKCGYPLRGAEKEAEVEYHGHTFPGYNIPVRSSRPEKKKMVLAKKGDEVRLIHFGQQGYKHNYSDAAKKNYLARSAGIRGKGGLTKDDKFSANYWARRELWPKNEPADGTAKDRPKTASKAVLLERAMGALGRNLQTQPVRTLLAGYGLYKAPDIIRSYRERQAMSGPPVGRGTAFAANAVTRAVNPLTGGWG